MVDMFINYKGEVAVSEVSCFEIRCIFVNLVC